MNGYRRRAMRNRAEATIEDLLANLSEAQRQAVAHTDGPLLILAGPGSGKTRVVTCRAAHLARTVARPSDILAITFTNKAAREMRERIEALGMAEGMTVCTFHALCARLLRRYPDRAGVPPNFTIFDREDRRKLIRQAIEECGLSTDNWSPSGIDREISLAKNDMLTPQAYAASAVDWRKETITRVYTCYEQSLLTMGGLDFDDLLVRMATLLQRDRELRDELEDCYRYVLIDEYQDTNAAQYKIARLLTEKRRNICATGDPDQSIYGWRGANIENILRFERDYPNAKVVRLEQNYRSTKRVLSAADAVIAHNVSRKEKALWTDKDDGVSIRVFELETGRAEAEMIARDIARQLRTGVRPNEIAVFYRINSLSRVIEEALLREGIAYQIARGVEFYSRKEVKDVLAYLRLLINPADEVSLLRIINTPPRGIGTTTVQRMTRRARETGRSIYDLVMSGSDLSKLGRSAHRVHEFRELLAGLVPALDRSAPDALKLVISHSGLQAHYAQAAEADDAPVRNMDELVTAAADYQSHHPDATVLDWLEHTALISDVDSVRGGTGVITLMTLHAAKGLEFAVVYIVGLERGILPFRRTEEVYSDEEEERRLLFVGMTRAKACLTLSHAQYRMQRGSSERTTRSPFLDELPKSEVEWHHVCTSPARRFPASDSDRNRLPEDIEEWTIGTLVQHPQHGLGQVMSIHRAVGHTFVSVQFKDGSQRSLALGIAPLRRVDFDDIGENGGSDW